MRIVGRRLAAEREAKREASSLKVGVVPPRAGRQSLLVKCWRCCEAAGVYGVRGVNGGSLLAVLTHVCDKRGWERGKPGTGVNRLKKVLNTHYKIRHGSIPNGWLPEKLPEPQIPAQRSGLRA